MNVIPAPIRDVYAFSIILYYAIAYVYHQGGCLDYFPDRVEDQTIFIF